MSTTFSNKALTADRKALNKSINAENQKDIDYVKKKIEVASKSVTEFRNSLTLPSLTLPTVGRRFKDSYRAQLVTSCICAAFLLTISINVMIESTTRPNNTAFTYGMCGTALFLSLIGLFLLPLIDTAINKVFTYMLIILGVLIVAIAAIGLILVGSETDNPVTVKAGLGAAGIGLVACVVVPVLTYFNATGTAGKAEKAAEKAATADAEKAATANAEKAAEKAATADAEKAATANAEKAAEKADPGTIEDTSTGNIA
jgi:hypothetical protein